jgi:uncharacterized repeat protein (TIGR02543 family)
MGLAGKSATFMRRLKRGLHHFLALVLAVSTLSAISVVSLPEANATTTGTSPCVEDVDSASNVSASQNGNDCIITFTAGTNTWKPPSGITSVRVLLVGGGGGGDRGQCGFFWGHGAGGGQVRDLFINVAPGSEYSVTVGIAGTGGSSCNGSGNSGTAGQPGGASSFFIAGGYSIEAKGGNPAEALNASRGGHSGLNLYAGAVATPNLGAGGGGGAGGHASGLDGGTGVFSNISGDTRMYGSGGAGKDNSQFGLFYRFSDGAQTRSDGTQVQLGSNNGFGGSDKAGFDAGLAGSAGVVIIRYTRVANCLPTNDANIGTSERYVTFETVGGCNWTIPNGVRSLKVAMVGGGGGGGAWVGGGGGGGGVLTSDTVSVTPGATQLISVAPGGRGAIASPNAIQIPTNGGDTTAFGLTAYGGGFGASYNNYVTGSRATSGGAARLEGLGSRVAVLNSISPAQGFAGGTGSDSSANGFPAGGGGGSASDGSNASGRNSGAGGNGTSTFLTGTEIFLGGGGGGGCHGATNACTPGSGTHGGGNGAGPGVSIVAYGETIAPNGTAKRGGGGGGAGRPFPSSTDPAYWGNSFGGNGGSGIVIVRYSLAPNAPSITGITSGNGSLSVAFSAAATGVTSSAYEYSLDSGGSWASTETTSSPFTIPSLNAASSYTVLLRAINGTTRSPSSNAMTASTKGIQASFSITSLTTSSKAFPYSQALSISTSGGSGNGAVTFAIAATGSTASGCALSNATATATVSATSSGTCLIQATKAEDASFLSITSAAATFTFNKATSTTVITCSNQTYTGSALTPCTARVTGDGGLDTTTVTFTYSNNTNAGTATANATYAESDNHLASSATQVSFTIAKATTTTTISCSNGTYTGSELTLCTATVTGAGGLNTTATVTYTNNTNAGTATANASYAESTNHLGSSATPVTFTIAKSAQSGLTNPTLSVTSKAFPYTQVLTATADGGSTSGAVGITGVTNGSATGCAWDGTTLTATASGTCVVTITKAGDANYNAVTTTATFTFNKAASTTVITCSNQTYTGSALTPCTAAVTGPGGLNTTATVTYTNNTNAGTATANATYAESANHLASSASQVTFTIARAVSTIGLSIGTYTFTGSAQGPDSATKTGSTNSVTYAYVGRGSTSYTSSSTKPTAAGTYTVTATVAEDTNYAAVSTSADFEILNASLVITPTISASSMVFGTSSGLPTISHTKSPNISLTTEPICSVYLASDTGFTTIQTISSTLAVGSYVVRCTGAAATNYTVTYGTNPTFSVTKANQSSFSITSISGTFGTTLALTTSGGTGGGAVTFATSTNGCSISGSDLTSTSAQTCVVTATKAADSTHEAISSSATNVVFGARPITLTVGNPASTSFTGSAASVTNTFTITSGSLAGSNAISGLTYTYTSGGGYNSTTAPSAVGTYTITGSSAVFSNGSSSNYTITYVAGSFTISAAVLSNASAPTVSATAGVLKSIAVSWSTVSNASSYTLKLYAADGTTLLATITGLSGTSRTITTSDHSSLADNTTYQVSITAIGTGSYASSDESTKVSVTSGTTFTLTYEYNSATSGNGTASTSFITGGTAITLPTPSRTGYGFDGWYEASDLSGTKLSSTYSPTQSRTIYAKWIGNTLNITYAEGTGGSGSAPASPLTVLYGSTFTTPANSYARAGYTFAGWSDGTNTYAASATYPLSGTVSAAVTLTATWTPNSNTVAVDTQGGSDVSSISWSTGTSLTLPATPTRTGHTFKGWYDSASGGNQLVRNAISFDGVNDRITVPHSTSFNFSTNITIEAWINTTATRVQHITTKGDDSFYLITNASGQVGFWLNGVTSSWNYTTTTVNDGNWHHVAATYNGSVIKVYIDGVERLSVSITATISTGSSAVEIGSRTNSSGTAYNFNFTGRIYDVRYWNVARTASQISSSMNAELTGSETGLVAAFLINQGAPGATNTNLTSVTNTVSGASNGTLSGFALSGSTSNWVLRNASYNPSNTSAFTIYAQWDLNLQTITYAAGTGGSGSAPTTPISVSYGSTFTTPSNTFTRAGYTFAGWSDGTNTYAAGATYPLSGTVASNITLTATWTANALTITYDSKGGTSVADGTVNTGASVSSAPTPPTRAGYTFSAWSATDGGTAISFPYAHGQTAGFTLFALWTANSLTVTYNSKGGSDVTSGSVNTGASISSAPTPPTRAGYTFSAWSATDGGTAISFPYAHGQTAGFTLFALWTANSLTVTYNSKGGSDVTSGSVSTGASISSAPTPPTRAGYTFSGWSATDGGTVVSFPFAHGQTAGFTLFAVWAANALTVTYDSQGGSAVSNGTVNTAASIQSAPTAPTRSGYYFLGWSATSAGVTVSFPYTHGQTSNFTLFAIWTIAVETTGLRINLDASNRDSLATSSRVWRSIAPGRTDVSTSSGASHTTNVTFTSNLTPGFITFPGELDGLKMFTAQLNGGASIVGTSGVTVETWIKLADNYSPSSTIQRIATHWFDSSSGLETNDSKDWNFRVVNGSLSLLHSNGPNNQTVTSAAVINQKFAGQWIHVGFTWGASGAIRFYLNGAPVGAEVSGLSRGASRTVTTAQIIIGAAPGGFIGSISKLRVYEGALTPSQVLSNFDNEFGFFGLKKITFNANDGSGTPATSIQWVPTSTSKALNANTFTRTGYTFAGWTAAADGTGTSYTDGQSVSISSPLTVFAKWTADGNVVVFNNNSGSGTMSNQSIISGTATALTTNSFTRAGYTFAGWNTLANGSGTAYTDGQSVTITAGMTLFARWTGTTNVVNYDSNGGSSVANGSFVTGGAISAAPTAPTRAGYTLTGWSETVSGSVITYPFSPTATSGITLYAIWAAISCSPTSTTTGGYTIYTFTTAGTCFWSVPNGITDVEILAVGGGGGGGYAWDNTGAGGGAGGQVKTGTATLSTTLEVTVGAGGSAGTTASRRGGTGANSAVSTLTAIGGSGGCAARATTCSIGAQATSLAGATGGAGGAGGASGRGGGGSNTAGVAPTTTTGGTGTASTYSGSSVTYGVGGAGGTARGFGTNITGTAGSVNTGNGGAGASAMNASGDVNGGAGASGIVIIRIASVLTIAFDSQGGSSVSDTSTVTAGIISSAPTAPTRSNYTFLGWFTAANGGNAIVFPYSHGQNANFTLYAQWALNSYAIVFNANNGSGSMANQPITHGVAANLSANLFSRANYVFHRWATNADGSGTTYNNLAQVTLTAGTTLYAQWTANTYVVTFSYNGADGGESQATAGYTTAGTAITLPVPTRTGFTFAGWHSDAALTTLIGSSNGSGTYAPTGATLSLNAYAKWTAINYTFTYDANSADSGSVPTETSKQITQTATIKANTGSLVRAGYTFGGWNTQSNGGGTNYLSGSLFTVGSSNVILYAKWNANTYTITYNLNGGTGNAQRTVGGNATNVTSDSFTTGGASVVLPDAGTLTRTGYTFGGWNTSAAGTGTNRLAGVTFTTVSDVIFYAKWNPITYTITYDANTGTGTAPTAGGYTTGQASPYVVLTNTFTKTSNVFGGWNTAANGTGISYSPGASITTLENIVLYALWIPQFTLHYAINGGTVNVGSTRPADALLNVNTTVSVFNALSRTGYTFDGWTNGATTIAPNGSFVIVEDSVLTAKWTAINYTITYNSDGGTEVAPQASRQIGQSFTVASAPSKPGHNFTGWSNGSTVVGADAVVVMGAANIAYTAQWVPRVYTITYDWNGGRGTAVPDVNYTFGTTAITLPLVGDRVRDGFTFAGWSESLGGSALGATYIPSQSRTLFARWDVGSFTVIYNLDRGTLANSTVSVPNGSATVLPLPTRANFVFDGWHTATVGGSLIGTNGASFTPTSSQTVYARWIQASLYGITNSLTRIGSVITVADVANTFSGANSNSSVSVSVPANALPAGTTINFDMVGDSSRARGLLTGISYVVSIAISWQTADGLVPDTAANKPISVTISNATIKTGATAYAIVNNVSTLLGTASQDGTITIALTSDPEVVVAAVKPGAPVNVTASSNGNQQSVISWSAPSTNGGSAITGYTVTANTGGTCTTSTLSCTISNLANGTAYTFTVTATNSVGTSVASSSASATTAALYVVTFDAKGGTAVTNGSFLTASTVSEPIAPTRAGYSFAGWSASDGGSTVIFPYAPGVTTAITLFARWDALDNAVNFDSKGGSDVTASVFSSGGTVTEPAAPTRSGFTFAGWSATDGGTAVMFPYAPGVVTDITLYARWTVVRQNNSGGGGSSSPAPSTPSEPAGSSAPARSNVTVVAPVTIVGDQETKLIAVQITTTAVGSDVKPPAIKLDVASEKIIAEVKVVEGKLVLTPEAGFSGRRTVTVTVTENGADRFIQIPLTVLPEAVTKPVLTPTAANRTVIRWTQSPNATAYTVLLNGKRVCTTSASNCSVSQVLGPNAVIEVVSNGGDRTVSERIEADFRQNIPVAITRLVSATNTKNTLSRVDTKALDRVVSLIRSQGFGTVVISEISTTSRTASLAAARLAAIKKYIDEKTGSREITFEIVPATSRTNFNNISVKG